jgi:hypothetical protein
MRILFPYSFRRLVVGLSDPILWTMLNAIKEQQSQIAQQQQLIERQQAFTKLQQRQLNALKNLACRSHRRAAVCK